MWGKAEYRLEAALPDAEYKQPVLAVRFVFGKLACL